jgi:hypothetical protein
VPHGHWKTLTLVAALRINGLTAPYVIDGAMDGPSFLAYVEQVLVPTLRKGNIVFMDNLRPHRIDGGRSRRRQGALLAGLLARPQSDRNGIFEAQGGAAQRRHPHRDSVDEADWKARQDICTRAMRKLLSTRWIRVTHINWKTL